MAIPFQFLDAGYAVFQQAFFLFDDVSHCVICDAVYIEDA